MGERLVRNERKLSTGDFCCVGGNKFYYSFTAGDSNSSLAQSSCVGEMPTQRSHSDDYPVISVSAHCGGDVPDEHADIKNTYHKINREMDKMKSRTLV